MEHQFTYRIEAQEAGQTIEYFLKRRGYSRQILIQLKKTPDGILRNGIWAYTRDRLEACDKLTIRLVEKMSSEQIEPVSLPFGVVYEDTDLLVVNKPAKMSIHPSMNHHNDTLANAVAAYALKKGETYPYRCINRLDRDTTGLLILAKHMLSAAILYEQMRERKIQRTYLALVKGRIEASGVLDLPIGRKPSSTIERIIDYEHGERAVTHYTPIRTGDNWTLLKCILETGRTHQIRVHMSAIGHPLPGDFLYGPEDTEAERQLLHSFRLSFTHPITKEPMVFTEPLPEDMKAYMNSDSKGDYLYEISDDTREL